jgi:hypothetical protein
MPFIVAGIDDLHAVGAHHEVTVWSSLGVHIGRVGRESIGLIAAG